MNPDGLRPADTRGAPAAIAHSLPSPMNTSTFRDYALVGIERVAITENIPVTRVDVMTRSRTHASLLEREFRVRPFLIACGGATLHAFPHLPAASAKDWLEAHGIAFTQVADGLRSDGPVTWVQTGFMANGRAA